MRVRTRLSKLQLQWEWEIVIPQFQTSVFLLPAFMNIEGERVRLMKNGRDRLVVLNKVAYEVIESVRGQHPVFVFTYQGKPITRMNNTAWRTAREKAGLPDLHMFMT